MYKMLKRILKAIRSLHGSHLCMNLALKRDFVHLRASELAKFAKRSM